MSGDSLAQENNFREPCYVEFAYGTWLNESISEDAQERKETVAEEQSCAFPTVPATTGPGADYPRTEVPPVSGADTFLDYPEIPIVPIPGAGDALAQEDGFVEPCGADYALGTWVNEPISESSQDEKALRAHQECVEPILPEVGGWVSFKQQQIICMERCDSEIENERWIYNAGNSGTSFKVRASFPFHLDFRPTKIRLDVEQTGLTEWDWELWDTCDNVIATLPTLTTTRDIIETDVIDFDTYGLDLHKIIALQNPTTGILWDVWFFVPVDPDFLYMIPNGRGGGGYIGEGWDLINSGIICGSPDDSSFSKVSKIII